MPLSWSFALRAVDRVVAVTSPGPAVAAAADRRVGYELQIHNGYASPLTGLAVRFARGLDSIEITAGDSLLLRTRGAVVALPAIAPRTQLSVHGWSAAGGDSATADLMRDGKLLDRMSVGLSDAAVPAVRTLDRAIVVEALPALADLPVGGEAEVVLNPPVAGWTGEASFPLPAGWDVIAASPAGSPAMTTVRDRNGNRVLVWHLRAPRTAPIVVTLRAGGSAPVQPVRGAPQRSEASRAAEKAREFVDGPGVQITAPIDGAVLGADRVYLGVRGERSTAIELFDGDSLIRKAVTRIDGSYDFIALPLAPGNHRLRVRMQNSWTRERWTALRCM